MARNLSAQTGIGSDANFINGNLVAGQTLVGEGIYQDVVQIWQKLMDKASITPNGNPDNETNDYQFLDALKYEVDGEYEEFDSGDGSVILNEKTKFFKYSGISPGNTFIVTIPDATPTGINKVLLYEIENGIDVIEVRNQSATLIDSVSSTGDKKIVMLVSDGTSWELFVIYQKSVIESIATSQAVAVGDGTRTSFVNIGDWDMFTTPIISVAHGLTFSDIRSVSVYIRNDAGTLLLPLNYDAIGAGAAGQYGVNGANVDLGRVGSGVFDGIDYNDTSYNRGYIELKYTP